MKDQFIHIMEYDHWANIKLLEYIDQLSNDIFHKPMNSVFPTIAETFYHIFRAHRIWFNRSIPELDIDENLFNSIPLSMQNIVLLNYMLF